MITALSTLATIHQCRYPFLEYTKIYIYLPHIPKQFSFYRAFSMAYYCGVRYFQNVEICIIVKIDPQRKFLPKNGVVMLSLFEKCIWNAGFFTISCKVNIAIKHLISLLFVEYHFLILDRGFQFR